MSQWGQQPQQGYQYPLQTGFQGANPQFQQSSQFQQNPQFLQQNPGQFQQQPQGFQQTQLGPQPTGFPGQRPGFQQPQQTGFPGASPSFLQSQPTGYPAGGSFQQSRLPPVPPLPGQFQNAQNNSFMGLPGQQQQQQPQPPQQINRYVSSSPGFAAPPPIPSQPPAFRSAPLVPQATGFIDPRLQMMSTTFMPINVSSPYGAGGMPQLGPQQLQGGLNLQQSFQQHNQAQRGTVAPTISWALSKAEKKNYDSIFRAWDTQGTGFINGQTALEVFGQSGLDKNDLAKIWNLSDIDDRGKLNLGEFHVAMGLIYRRLNGNPVPDELPPELVPPSARDLSASVDILKDILKHDARARSPSSFDSPQSRLPERSFIAGADPRAGGRQDATVYRHTDSEPPGGVYQPSSRHIDRSAVRARGDDSPSSDLLDMKKQLEKTAKMLDKAAESEASRTAEDEALDREMEDLRYRVKRVQDDLDYVSKGPRSSGKDEERRRLERELLKLMHERVPEVERKIEDRERRREKEKREWARDRDRRNDRFGRFDGTDSDRYSPSSSSRYDDRDRGYSKASYDRDYDRDRDRDRGGSYRRSRSRSRDRDYDRDKPRDRSPATTRSEPPPPPPPPAAAPSLPPPAPAPSTTPQPMKNMTPAERQAFIREQARQRLEARKAALGVTAPSSPSVPDTSVQDRLAQEKREAEEKAAKAEKAAQERENQRRERLEAEKAIKEGRTTPAATSTPTTPVPRAKSGAPAAKTAPPPPKPRTRAAPPTPVKKTVSTPPVSPAPPVAQAIPAPPPPPPAAVAQPAPPPPRAPIAPPAQPEVDPEEEKFRARELALRKQREAREERLKQMEREEQELSRKAEEEYQARKRAIEAKRAPSPAPSSPVIVSPPLMTPSQSPTPAVAAPPAPPPPPPPAPPVQSDGSSNNPFARFMRDGPGAAPATTRAPAPADNKGSTNPFYRAQTAPPPTAPAPPKSPGPPAIKTAYNTAPRDSEDEDWDDLREKDEDDSDDEINTSRPARQAIAQQLFGSILPPARPQSAGPSASTAQGSATPTPTPPPPPPPPAPPAPATPIPTFAPPAPPAAPVPPPALPPAQSAPAAPRAAAGDVSALMASIQGGARLKKAITNDRSAAPVAGRVLGDAAPPSHIIASPRPPSPPAPTPETGMVLESVPLGSRMDSQSSNRQSVDWYAGLAADQGNVVPQPHTRLPSTAEEDEGEDGGHTSPVNLPQINVTEAQDPMDDVDMSTEHRVRTLYPYESTRSEELSFKEDVIILAHPSKSGSDWWYGRSMADQSAGFFPKTYAQALENVKAVALYPYTPTNPDELPFAEGDELVIVDRSDANWWKVEQSGMLFLVPSAYFEVVAG